VGDTQNIHGQKTQHRPIPRCARNHVALD